MHILTDRTKKKSNEKTQNKTPLPLSPPIETLTFMIPVASRRVDRERESQRTQSTDAGHSSTKNLNAAAIEAQHRL